MSARRNHGFTLVELLVVIGIIALLISVLLPALNRARQSASLVACESNFRQIYNAVLFYANQNKGMLPLASEPSWSQGSGSNAAIFLALEEAMGRTQDPQTGPFGRYFKCPEALEDNQGANWVPSIIRTVRFHPRAFVGYDSFWVGGGTLYARPYRLARVKNSAEKIAMWDAPQLMGWFMCPEPEAINLDGWRWGNGGTGDHAYMDPPKDGDKTRWDQPLSMSEGPNVDPVGWWSSSSIRYRHMRNTTTVAAFFDGHVESRKIGEIKVKEICIAK